MSPPAKTRHPNSGKFKRTRVHAEHDAEALRLRDEEGLTYAQIAERLGLAQRTSAMAACRRALESVTAPAAEAYRRNLEARLEVLYGEAMDILTTSHEVIYQGALTGIADDGPRLAAIDRLVKLIEQLAKLRGLHVDTVKAELTGPDGGPLELTDARTALLARLERLAPVIELPPTA